jgi:hypothetical protein
MASVPPSAPGTWRPDLPTGLVVACSDGRHQEELDAFLRTLGVEAYDRVYVPGGPGALATGGGEFTRAHRVRSDCLFLIEAHKLDRVFLFFHGAAPGGPGAAVCGDYQRKLSGKSAAEIAHQQDADAAELLRGVFPAHLSLHVYRIEVFPDSAVRFVQLQVVDGRRPH